MLMLDPTTTTSLSLVNFLHRRINALAIANRFSATVSGAMSKDMYYLSVNSSRSNIPVSRHRLGTLRLTLDMLRPTMQVLVHLRITSWSTVEQHIM
ncbi:hypothetical protein A2U01_0066870 [Trifolium medium]|uniref:Uncharacterized protein n=1 Tax=Trifolium medium TaxID=97028 RepID=A0A392S9R5_9FABA|nr:hypothetical protein [Trifolium medium]